MNDYYKHAIAGLLAGVTGAALYGLMSLLCSLVSFDLPIAGIAPTPAISAFVAGVTKEFADAADNKANPGMHSVDPWDVAATTWPGIVLSALLTALLIAGSNT